ncbi:MAG: hypothetical protein KDE27_04955 [Planctomycetes bacterium]|nr:hypothetical protein [Planctomycetota bacterium]
MKRVLAAFLLLQALAAQAFIVDRYSGPGTNFTSLVTAVANVPDGAVLLVRPGSYSAFVMSGKGLTILADPGVDIGGDIQIANTAAHQAVTLRGLIWQSVPPLGRPLKLLQCAGPVLIEQLTQPAGSYYPGPTTSFAVGVYADGCAGVTLRECQIGCTLYSRNSHTVIEDCAIRGEGDQQTGLLCRNAVTCEGGTLVVAGANTLLEGGDAHNMTPFSAPGVGVSLIGSASLRAVGGAIRSGRFFGTGTFPGGCAICPIGASRVSPRVLLFTANPAQPEEPTDDVMPELTALGTTLGGMVSASVTTEVGDAAILAVGLPVAATTVAGFQDPFWLDPGLHVVAAIGVQQVGMPVTGSFAVPNVAGFVGLRLDWQAACFGPVTGMQLSNPSATLVH